MKKLLLLGQLIRAGMDAGNDGRFDDALFQLSQAETLARALDRPLHVAKVHNNQGLVNAMAGNREAAMACFKRAEALAVETAGEGNVLQRAILRNMDALAQQETRKAA